MLAVCTRIFCCPLMRLRTCIYDALAHLALDPGDLGQLHKPPHHVGGHLAIGTRAKHQQRVLACLHIHRNGSACPSTRNTQLLGAGHLLRCDLSTKPGPCLQRTAGHDCCGQSSMQLNLYGVVLNAETVTLIISTALLMAFSSGMGLLTLSLLYSTASSSGTCVHRRRASVEAKGTDQAACQASTSQGSPCQIALAEIALADRCRRALPPLAWQQQMAALNSGLTIWCAMSSGSSICTAPAQQPLPLSRSAYCLQACVLIRCLLSLQWVCSETEGLVYHRAEWTLHPPPGQSASIRPQRSNRKGTRMSSHLASPPLPCGLLPGCKQIQWTHQLPARSP